MSAPKMVPYTNPEPREINIAGKTVRPGETRDVDARFVPAPATINSSLELLFINLKAEPRYFGDYVVKPGEHARLSANFFVDPNTDADQAQAKIFRQYLDQNLTDIGRHLSVFTDDELAVLQVLEALDGSNARKGLTKLIDDELAVRQAERDFSPDMFREHLQMLSDEDLDLALLEVKDDDVKLALVQEELSDRKANREAGTGGDES